MFGFGHGPELIIILVIALIVLGPGKIPEVAQMLGKGIRELRQASSDLQNTFNVNELMNPTPAPPPPTPPVEAAPAPIVASTETILPPAKPKRVRKRPATNVPSSAAVDDGQGEGGTSVALATATGLEPTAKPAARRRPSKKTSEPISFDAPA